METKILSFVFLCVLALAVLTTVFYFDIKCEYQFGDSGCVNPVVEKWTIDRTKAIKKKAIFVSIASYRDTECTKTINSLFSNARYPDKVFVGVVQQNKKKKEDCIDSCADCKKRRDSGHIRTMDFSFKDAKGPCFARYQATKLWDGEEFFFQIDSHTEFDKDWDVTLLDEYYSTNDPKAVISGYPPTREQFRQIVKSNYKQFPMMCNIKRNQDGLPQVTAQLLDVPEDGRPVPVAYAGAGLMMMHHQALFDVPYDPHLNFLFFGEELLYSARLWTHGYNIYNPTKVFVSHYYDRPGPKFWDDNSEYEPCRQRAIGRVKYLLGLGNYADIDEDFSKETAEYGMGTLRSLADYWAFLNFDFKHESVDMCKVNSYA